MIKVPASQPNKTELSLITKSEFKNKLSAFILGKYIEGKKTKTISAWTVYSSENNVKFFIKESLKFYSKDTRFFNFFQGHMFNPTTPVNLQIIQPFLDHIKFIMCYGGENLNKYVLSWLSFVFQYPNLKTRTALIFTGQQRTGMNTFTDTICNLFGSYANDNCNLENIIGHFNGALQYKRLIVCNEGKSYVPNKSFDAYRLKKLITEKTMDITKKFQDSVHVENVSNFIFLSNNFAPIQIQEGDMSYFVSDVSPEKRTKTQLGNGILAILGLSFSTKTQLAFYIQVHSDNWLCKLGLCH